MTKHVLVTGGCGFIGSNLVPRLEASGFRVRVIDSEILGKLAHLGPFKGEFIRGDIRDAAALDAALTGVDAVVHLAADTRVIESIADPEFNFDVNVVGSFRLLEAMRTRGIKTLINASTGGAILGECVPPVHEEMVPRPVSPYGATKLAVEGLCSAYAGSYGLNALSLRFSNVYGPRSFHKGSVVAAFCKQILQGQPLIVYGDGEQVRDFVFVDDVCDGIMRGLATGGHGVFQLGSGVPLSLNQLIEALRQVTAPFDINVEFRPDRAGEVKRTWCDVTLARNVLGFAPDTPLIEGLERTWQWFLDQNSVDLSAQLNPARSNQKASSLQMG